MPDQKTMWTRCLGGFSVMWVTKLLIFPVEIKIFCPKMTKFGPKLAFLVKLGQATQAYSVRANGYGHFQTSQFQILYFRHSLKAFYFLKCDSHFIQGWPSHSRFWTRAASRLFCFQAQSRCLVDSKKLIRIRRRNTWRIHSPSKLWPAENCPGKYF